MLVNCKYAKDINCGICVQCELGLYGGAPDISICNNICQKRVTLEGESINKRQSTPLIQNTELAIEPPNLIQDKFDTCIYKSEVEISEVRRTCCHSITLKGYKCNKLGYFPLSPEVCKNCVEYINKSVNNKG